MMLARYTVGTSLTTSPTIHLWKQCQYRPQSSDKELYYKVISRVLKASNNTSNSSVIAFDDADYGLLLGEVLFFSLYVLHTSEMKV